MIKLKILITILLVHFLDGTPPVFAELTLEQALKETIQRHPDLQVGQYAEKSKEQDERRVAAAYYPRVSAMAIEAQGFPGSSGATGVEGIMISPFHKGPAAGFVLQQNVWDFGRTAAAVKVAERQTDLTRRDICVEGLKVGKLAQEAFFNCSRDRSLAEVYSRVATESGVIQKEVNNFVRVGQRSIVEKYLSESQTEEANTIAEDYKRRFHMDNQRLALLTGRSESTLLCPLLDEKLLNEIVGTSPQSNSPLLSRVEAEALISKSETNLSEKEFNPKIVGLMSLGWMESTQLEIPKENYSAAIAVIWPLFEGFKTAAEVKKYQLKEIQDEKAVEATRFGIDDANLNFDQEIESAETRISHLKKELEIAENGFEIAKKRYSNLQGNLIDLRETIRNLARTSSDLKLAFYDLATQKTEKALLNGHWNSVISRESACK